LTERETTILVAVAGGLTTKAISRELWLSEHTVKFHLTNTYRKLGVQIAAALCGGLARMAWFRLAFDRRAGVACEPPALARGCVAERPRS
jgi:DNA-binding CsgD family transcriptional regulator